MAPTAKPIEERFWPKVNVTVGDDCWHWEGAVSTDGYGHLTHVQAGTAPRTLSAHRVSWELANGRIPEGMCVLHRCDNRPCVNPDHLFLGTKRDNTMDGVAKGRIRAWPEKLRERT